MWTCRRCGPRPAAVRAGGPHMGTWNWLQLRWCCPVPWRRPLSPRLGSPLCSQRRYGRCRPCHKGLSRPWVTHVRSHVVLDLGAAGMLPRTGNAEPLLHVACTNVHKKTGNEWRSWSAATTHDMGQVTNHTVLILFSPPVLSRRGVSSAASDAMTWMGSITDSMPSG